MGRWLGQLACGACRQRFWPPDDASSNLVIPCPHCGAGHANPDALPYRERDHMYVSAAGRRVREWARRHWIAPMPRDEPDRLAALAPLVFRLGQLAHHLRAEPPRRA